MMRRIFQITIILYSLLFILPKTAFAQDVNSLCGSISGSPEYYDTPPVAALVCTGIQVLNFGFFLVGGVFVLMFLFGMYKYATAWGDPKGIQGAQQTVTSAIIGAIVCFGAVTILYVTGNVVGLNSSFTEGVNPFNKLINGICSLFLVADLNCDGTKRPN